MTGRRGLVVAIACAVLGATLMLAATAQPWLRSTSRAPAPTADRADAFLETVVTHDAADVAPAVTALGLVALASVAALAGSRGVLRRGVGAVIAGVGAAGLLVALRVVREPRRVAETAPGADLDVLSAPWVAVAGGALVVAAGVLTVASARRWSRLGSAYDAPRVGTGSGLAPAEDDVDLWERPEERR